MLHDRMQSHQPHLYRLHLYDHRTLQLTLRPEQWEYRQSFDFFRDVHSVLYPRIKLPILMLIQKRELILMDWGRCAFYCYEDEREVIAAYVSTCGLSRQSQKGKLRDFPCILHCQYTTHWIKKWHSYHTTEIQQPWYLLLWYYLCVCWVVIIVVWYNIILIEKTWTLRSYPDWTHISILLVRTKIDLIIDGVINA